MGMFRAAHALAALGWLATVLPLGFGPGLLRLFDMERWDDHLPTSALVAGLLILSLWMLIRRMRVGPLRGRWTLWSSVAGLAFTMIGCLIFVAAPGEWTVWAGPIIMGPAFFILASEPFVKGEA